MKKFLANEKYYTQTPEGFSSTDEFDISTRVHITNEIPPLDMFDLIHSSLRNEYWKWFVGDSFLSHDVEYNELTDGAEVLNSENGLEQFTIAKYVNGIRSKNYGPIPRNIWVPAHKELVDANVEYIEGHYEPDYSEQYHRYELNGVLLPEFDLLLHEGYRYLEKLYPDHPNWMKLLTLNEFNDDISQSAYFINYNEDVNFMDWLSYFLKSSNKEENDDEVAIQESANLKIRNLRHHAFRRKFYGSKTGPRMLGNDIFQHISIYPLAEYIPIEPFDKPIKFDSVNNKWFSQFEKNNLSISERKIDRDHPLLKRQFRLQDNLAQSHEFIKRFKEPTQYFGTAYPTPLSLYDLYEYTLERIDEKNELTYLTIERDFRPGQRVKFNGQPDWKKYIEGDIAEIYHEDAYDTKCELRYSSDGSLDLKNSQIKTIVKKDFLTHVSVDIPLNPIYTELKIYPSNEALLQKLIDYNNQPRIIQDNKRYDYHELLGDYFTKMDESEKVYGSTKALHDALYSTKVKAALKLKDPAIGLFSIDPHQNGCFYMAPQQFLTVFEDELNIKLNTEQWEKENPYLDDVGTPVDPTSILEVNNTSMSSEGILKPTDILIYDKNETYFISKVLDISNSYIQFTLKGNHKSKKQLDLVKEEINSKENAEYCLAFKFGDGNQDSRNKVCVLYGSPKMSDAIGPDIDGLYAFDRVYFNIKAIPKVKSHSILRRLYSTFDLLAVKKFISLYTLFTQKSTKNSAFNTIKKNYSDLLKHKETFDTCVAALKREIAQNIFVYNSRSWRKLIEIGQTLCKDFEAYRPILMKKLLSIYEQFVKNNNVITQQFDLNRFSNDLTNFSDTYDEYVNEYIEWIAGEVAIIPTFDYYSQALEKVYPDFESRQAVTSIMEADNILFNDMLPNRSLLLNPVPEDLLMTKEITTFSSYSLLTGQDRFYSMFHASKNKYDDLIDWEVLDEFGHNGYLNNTLEVESRAWDFGVLNTASLAETTFENGEYVVRDIKDNENKIDLIEDHFSSNGEGYIEESSLLDLYSHDAIPFVTLNYDISLMSIYKPEDRKFSYASSAFLEKFLPDERKNNICGELQNFNKVELLVTTEEDSNWVILKNKESINRINFISTGDQMIGPTIENDTFVDQIDSSNNKIRLSKKLTTSGEIIATFLCKNCFYAEDNKEDLFSYRERLSKNLQADSYSIIRHGINTEEPISNYSILSPVDISDFREQLLRSLQEQPIYKSYFNKFVNDLYFDKNYNHVIVPSIYKTSNENFFEVNSYMKYDDTIMKQEILGYFEQYVDDFNKASEKTNIGVAINAYTKSDNNVTTDENISSRFITTEDWKVSYPAYIKIGRGCLEEIFSDHSIEEQEKTKTDRISFYNKDYFNDGLYSEEGSDQLSQSSLKHYYDIDDPVFTVQLGEYEISNKYKFDNRTITNLQFSVIRRQLNMIKQQKAHIINKQFYNANSIEKFSASYSKIKINNIDALINDYSLDRNINYCGEWVPSLNRNGHLVYPEKPINTNIINIYSITKDYNFSNIIVETKAKLPEIKKGSILIYDNDAWQIKQMNFAGLYGDTETLEKLFNKVVTIDGEIKKVSSKGSKSIDLSVNATLKARLLYKVLSNCGAFRALDGINEDYETLLFYYNKLYNGEELTDLPETVIYNKDFDSSKLVKAQNYWFIYIGFANDKYSDSLKEIGLKEGQLLGLLYINNGFQLISIKDSIFSYNFNFKKDFVDEIEYDTAIGLNCSSKTRPILPVEKAKDINNTIDYKITDIVKNSCKSSIQVDLDLEAKGYEYLEDGSVSPDLVDIKISKDNLFADDVNKLIYTTYNGKKYGIYQENNKYFKNIINNIVELRKEKTLGQEGILIKDSLNPVDGFDFDGNSMTLFDRILSVNRVDLRSIPKNTLESNFYSNYKSITGILKGFVCEEEEFDPANLILEVSYREAKNPQILINKIQQKASLQKFKPFINDKEFSNEELKFGQTIFENVLLNKSDTINVRVNDLLAEADTTGLELYKNLLVTEGVINTADPNNIFIDNREAISQISVSDTLIDIVPLNSVNNAYVKVTLKDKNKIVRSIGWKNDVFIVACDDFVGALHITNMSQIDELRPYEDNDFTKVEFGIANYKVNSLSFDEENQRWIISLLTSNDKFLGTFAFEASVTGDEITITNVRMVYPDPNTTQVDFDEYALTNIYITENKYTLENYQNQTISDAYNGGKVLARDLSFSNLPRDSYEYIDPNFTNEFIDLLKLTNSDRYLEKRYSGNKEDPSIVFDPIDYKVPTDGYLKVSFDLVVRNGGVSMYCSGSKNEFSGIQEYWTYNKNLEKWAYSSSEAFKDFISNYGSDGKVDVYFCGTEFANHTKFMEEHQGGIIKGETGIEPLSDHLGEFLWKLPRTNLDSNRIVVVAVIEDKETNLPYILAEGLTDNESVRVSHFSFSAPLQIDQNKILEGKYKIGPYQPEELKDLPQYTASNFNGYQAVVCGATIFVKSPINIWQKKSDGRFEISSQTKELFWKRARLPSMHESSYELFSDKTLEEAYLLVETQRQLTLDLIEDNAEMYGPGIVALRDWLKENEVLEYITDEELPSTIRVEGVQYQYTSQGPRANFDKNRFEKYEADVELQTYSGITSMVYFKHQIYLNYLRDYYEIILGCNRASNFIKDGIKDLRVTDSHIVIITNNDDILSIKLENTYSKEQIENINNWSVKSLSPVMEIPYLDILDTSSFDPYSYGVNGVFYRTGFRFGNSIKKLYKINSYFINKNIQIFAGYIQYNEEKYRGIISQMKKIDAKVGDGSSEAYNNLLVKLPKKDGKPSEAKYPFICYSTDGGESFFDYGLHSLGAVDFPLGNAMTSWTADSIVKVGNSIYVFLEDENHFKHKTVEFDFEPTGGNDLLQQRNNLSDWTNEKDFYNAYKPFQFYGGYYCTLLGSTERKIYQNGFFIEKPYQFSSESSEITVVGTNFISYKSLVPATEELQRLRVLISINTKKMIEENTKYLSYSSEYLSQTGELLVSDKIKVDSFNKANRIYSVNECLPVGQYSNKHIPCVAQDVSRNIYEFEGDEYIPMKNSEGQNIYLCDESGNYLLKRNPNFLKQSILKITDLLKMPLTYSNSFLTMAKIKENYKFSKSNERITNYLSLCKVLFESISYKSDNPKARFELIEHPEINLKDFEMIEWPKDENNNLIRDIELLRQTDNESMFNFISALEIRDGDYSQELFDSKFEPKKLANSSDYYVYDKERSIMLINEKEFNADISMLYASKEKSEGFLNKAFSINNNVIDRYNGKIINGIYLKEKGYGGLVDSTEWKDHLPWDNDKEAFTNKLLKNEFGSYIYLFDENMNKVLMRNSLFFMSPSEVKKITYENLSVKDNEVKIRIEDYDEEPSIQHIYKLERAPLEMYYSNEICLKDITENEQLSIIKFYRNSIDSDIENIVFLNKFYSDEDKVQEIEAPIYYDNESKEMRAKVSGTFYAEGDTLRFTLDNKEFSIPCIEVKFPKIKSSTSSVFFADKSNSFKIEFIESVDNAYAFDNNLKIISINNNSVELVVENFEDSSFEVEKNNEKFVFNIDVRKIEPELLLERTWYNDSYPKENIRFSVYDGDKDCSDIFTYEVTDSKIIATSIQNKEFKLEKEIILSDNTEFIDFERFIFTEKSEEMSYSLDKTLLIEGLFGETILLTPKYSSFEELVSRNTRIITKDEVDFSKQSLESVSATQVLLNESALEEGTLLKVKILPIKSIYLKNNLMNNEDYYSEVSILDIDKFGYDRVWINNDAFLDSPFKLDNIFYNSENMADYSIESWKNKDNYSVYLCDKTGHFVKGYVLKDKLKYERIGDDIGDCSKEIYQDVDVRMVPKKCNYETTFEKFKDIYLDDKIGNNPFIETIQLNQKKQIIDFTYIWKKVGGKFTKVENDFIKIIKPYSFDFVNDEIAGFTDKEYFDEKNGKLNFILTSVSEEDKYIKEFNLCGIKYKNPFYNNDDYWSLKDDFDSQSKHSFIVDSIEDIFNKEVNSVLNVTELGIFNKKDQLIAYLHHPIAQYDTKKNHISYNLFIEDSE